MKDAPFLILDEATAHLDAVTEQVVMGALDKFITGRTALIIAHQRPLLASCDRVLVLNGGKLSTKQLTIPWA